VNVVAQNGLRVHSDLTGAPSLKDCLGDNLNLLRPHRL